MILWHQLVEERPSFPVPSTHHQTLLSKAIFEHCLDCAQVASITLASKSIQNSSLSPNFASNIVIEEQTVKLFEAVFHPSSSLPLQFVPGLTWNCDMEILLHLVTSTKYFVKSLRALVLQGCVVSEFLRAVEESTFPSLERLEIEYCSLTEQDVDAINSPDFFPRLESISVRDNESTNAFVSTLRNLTLLSAPGTDLWLQGITSNKLSKLTSLCLFANCYDLSDESLANVATLQETLAALYIEAADSRLSWPGLSLLTALKHLTTLHLGGSVKSDDMDWEAFLSSFPKLSDLDLWGCCVRLSTALPEISKMKNLTSLNLAGCTLQGGDDTTSTDDDLLKEHLPSLAASLVHINLSDLPTISSIGLSSIASLTQLITVDLSDNDVTDDVLRECANKLKRLQQLKLKGCCNVQFNNLPVFHSVTKLDVDEMDISDESLAGIRVSFPELKELKMSSYYTPANVTDIGLEHVSSLQFLEELQAGECKAITNRGLKLIFTRLTWLKQLSISGSGDDVTDEVFTECEDEIRRRLIWLDIRECESVTTETVKRLKEICPHLCLESSVE